MSTEHRCTGDRVAVVEHGGGTWYRTLEPRLLNRVDVIAQDSISDAYGYGSFNWNLMQPACACACARVPGRNCRGKHGIIYGLGCDFHFLCWPSHPAPAACPALCPVRSRPVLPPPSQYTTCTALQHRTTKLSQPLLYPGLGLRIRARRPSLRVDFFLLFFCVIFPFYFYYTHLKPDNGRKKKNQ